MKIMMPSLVVVTVLIGTIVTVGIVCYGIGTGLPVNHSVSVVGTVNAPPAKVFQIMANVGAGATWRKQVKSVVVLPPDAGRDRWVEDLGHGRTMNFIALRSDPPSTFGSNAGPETVVARREVKLEDPHAAYGGTWTYELSPTRTNEGDQATQVKITEDGFINPPIYRFMMAHVVGMTSNLDQYLRDLQGAAAKVQ